MVRTIVLGGVTFLVSLGIAVGATMFLGGGEVDLSTALSETAADEHSTEDDAVTDSQTASDVENLISELHEGESAEEAGADEPTGAPTENAPATQDGQSSATGEPAAPLVSPAAEGLSGVDPVEVAAAVAQIENTEAIGLPEARLGKIFGAMQPREAARVLEQMDDRDVATILTMLNDRQAAAVLANLPPQRAAGISRSGLGNEVNPR